MPRKRKQDQDGLYRRPDSPKWWASYVDASGKRVRRSTGATERQEAEALLAKWKLEAHRERQWGEQPTHTFDELMVAYLQGTSGERRPRSEEAVKLHIWRLRQSFGGQEMESLSGGDIGEYIRKRKGEGVGNSTINREMEVLSAAITYASREWEWPLPNPVKGRMLKEPEGRLRWLTRAEAAALIRAAEAEPKAEHLGPLITLALHTGMRRGELLGLEWSRVDRRAGLIYLEGMHTKAGKRRTVPLNAIARNVIIVRERYKATHCPDAKWVFSDEEGNQIGSVKRSFATACRRAGIEDFHFHDLRHTCAAWLVQAGVPLTEVRDVLGHSTVKMTERYAHLAPENTRAALARLEGTESRSSHVEESGEGEIRLKVV
ncbi:tyrosine-type recombinase/integrase [Thiocystis violacea]|uniref:tyrosine-type recombinase/integrase n=1 Tax=Thiocystis violacea TaxID=13725 RepID=UPI001906EE1E|nr:site-specific integrase [Thiocystis violacea]MBK1722798.1 recombinase XerD [Thiocystis violacea]